MKKLYLDYITNFKGLSKEIWLLSLVTFINRVGAMVIPFLSLYFANVKELTLPEIGWIMTAYGLGSTLGVWLGGKLVDLFGFYKVIVASLFFGGIGFMIFQVLDSYWALCAGIFLLIMIADAYRPGIFVAVEAYSKPKNVTRSIALIRLAINLGFSIGPLVGGLIIAHINYGTLFWIDGITCILAAIGLIIWLKPKEVVDTQIDDKQIAKEGVPPHKNSLYLLLFIIMVLSSIAFVQYFSVVPLYYERAHFLSEDLIGWLMFLNGAMIVIVEMPLVVWMERINVSKTMATFWGIVFMALSFLVLNVSSWGGVLIIGMILMTIGEMIGSPFSNALALQMAPKGRKGSYMGLYSMSFSLSHIFGHNSGMNLVDQLGFDTTWYVMAIFLLLVGILTLWLKKLLKKSPKYETY